MPPKRHLQRGVFSGVRIKLNRTTDFISSQSPLTRSYLRAALCVKLIAPRISPETLKSRPEFIIGLSDFVVENEPAAARFFDEIRRRPIILSQASTFIGFGLACATP